MTFDQFAQPAEQEAKTIDVDFALKNGMLLLIYPRSFQSQVQTKFGVNDAIAVDLVVLDGPESPLVEVHVNVWLYGVVLKDQLKPSVGAGPVLGRVGQSVAKVGKNPAWLLESYTPADAAVASAYLKANPDPFAEPVTFTAPATSSGLSAPGASRPAAASTPINTDDPAVVALLAQLEEQRRQQAVAPF
jgi:hypothetical protein